jgi:hypothetical protein
MIREFEGPRRKADDEVGWSYQRPFVMIEGLRQPTTVKLFYAWFRREFCSDSSGRIWHSPTSFAMADAASAHLSSIRSCPR